MDPTPANQPSEWLVSVRHIVEMVLTIVVWVLGVLGWRTYKQRTTPPQQSTHSELEWSEFLKQKEEDWVLARQSHLAIPEVARIQNETLQLLKEVNVLLHERSLLLNTMRDQITQTEEIIKKMYDRQTDILLATKR